MNREQNREQLRLAADKQGLVPVLAAFGHDLRFRIPMSQTLWDTSIDELNLTVRARNGLMRAGADTIGRVAELIMTEKGLTNVRNLGRKSVSEIKMALLTEGYRHLNQREREAFWQFFLDNNPAANAAR